MLDTNVVLYLGKITSIKAKIQALLEGILQSKILSCLDLLAENDFAIAISWTCKRERGVWKYDG